MSFGDMEARFVKRCVDRGHDTMQTVKTTNAKFHHVNFEGTVVVEGFGGGKAEVHIQDIMDFAIETIRHNRMIRLEQRDRAMFYEDLLK